MSSDTDVSCEPTCCPAKDEETSAVTSAVPSRLSAAAAAKRDDLNAGAGTTTAVKCDPNIDLRCFFLNKDKHQSSWVVDSRKWL